MAINTPSISLFDGRFKEETWIQEKINKLSLKMLDEKHFLVLSFCYNAEILRHLGTCPPGFNKPVVVLQNWKTLLKNHQNELSLESDFYSKGLFLRRAADITISKQIKNPVTDIQLMILTCALLKLSIIYFESAYSKVIDDLKTIAALELLEANVLLNQYLPQYEISDEVDTLLNEDLLAELWVSFDLPKPASSTLFDDFSGTTVQLDTEFLNECVAELWRMREDRDFLTRVSWLACFEDQIWSAVHEWFKSIKVLPSSPRNTSADGRKLYPLDLEIYFLMCGASAASSQVHPDPLFPSTVAKIHAITENQIKCWKMALGSLCTNDPLDNASHMYFQCIIEATRLEKPPSGVRTIFRVFDYLRERGDDYECQMLAEKFAQRLVELSIGSKIVDHEETHTLFPSVEEPLDDKERRIAHEEASSFLAMCDLQRGWHSQAEARIKQFNSTESKQILLEIYTLWAETSTGELQEDVIAKLEQLQADLYGPSAILASIHQKASSSPVGISWKALDTSAFITSPRSVKSNKSIKSPTSDISFVSATSGYSISTRQRFPEKEIDPNRIPTTPSSPQDDYKDAMPILSPQQENQTLGARHLPKPPVFSPSTPTSALDRSTAPRSVENSFYESQAENFVVEMASLTFLEDKQRKLKERLITMQNNMKKTIDEANKHNEEMSKRLEATKIIRSPEPPKTSLSVDQAKKLAELEARLGQNPSTQLKLNPASQMLPPFPASSALSFYANQVQASLQQASQTFPTQNPMSFQSPIGISQLSKNTTFGQGVPMMKPPLLSTPTIPPTSSTQQN
ncbi:unnamed protein product, partial [Mesorhabditis belari]|uniref:Uncharacterized protein n=1 Tax=Mesorhabditis belari TaxID=2138241 RepID=A0AAF3FCV7_9BILA